MRVVPHEPSQAQAQAWDACVAAARNGSLLHQRGFMDYHAHRFHDASLHILDDKEHVVAVFPANRDGDHVVSHGGLTYGALVMTERLTQVACLQAFELIAQHYRAQGVGRITYKPVPHVFHRSPCEEDLYALFRNGAKLVRRDASSAISLRDPFSYSKGRKWSINKARKAGLAVTSQADPGGFHALLTEVLSRHGASPVHSLEELRLLMQRFPEAIQLHEVALEGRLLAGALVFASEHVVHTQYLAVSPEGREQFALDLLIAHLIEVTYANCRYFSFGISTEQAGTVLNEGLIAQKEGFGGRAVVHDQYEWSLGG